MHSRRFIWIVLCLLCVAGAWFLWHQEKGRDRSLSRPHEAVTPSVIATRSLSTAPKVSSLGVVNTNAAQISLMDWNTNKLAGRLSNTTKTIGQLVNDNHAILLENALIDTANPLNFVFPKNLQPPGDPGAYIIQANGPIDNAFRALLAQAGATIVSYIPNNAYLVRADASVAGGLGANPLIQAMVPFEPYYKIQSSLLPQAVEQMDLPDNAVLNLGLFADDVPATVSQIEKLGGQVVGQDRSPFGPIVRVIPPRNWTTLATLSGVQIVEPSHSRATANDLSRATVGVAANSLAATNYLGLTGTNVMVEVNDTGIDAQHPDLTAGGAYGRVIGVIGVTPQSLVDPNGHGTHVAGIIAGSGFESLTVTNARGSIMPGTNGQFRGMAPGATLYSVVALNSNGIPDVADQQLQEAPALTNALISNNSWTYIGDNNYDLAAASYDAAVRDALPTVTHSQPVLFVFAAGNAGNGADDSDFGGGIADSIESPATAKNVITVGALQEDRNITNTVTNAEGTVSAPWQLETSTSYRVAGFSSRGNVGIGTEGTFGRYKPDVAAPGTFIISTRSKQWDIGTYFYQDPTNNQIQVHTGIAVQPGSLWKNVFPSVPTNAVQLTINIFPPAQSPFLFTDLPIYVGLFTSTNYDFFTTTDQVLIPGSPEAPANYLQSIMSSEGFLGGFKYAVSNNTAVALSFDLVTDVITTNGTGNYFLVLSNLDQSIGTPNPGSTGPGPYYRYETGTSMAAADVSGVLALMQQFYAGAYGVRPSPAMLKAMLINGARATGFYNYQAQNTLNYEGWGLINLPDSLPPGITNQPGQSCSAYVQDQNPTNALATGDRQTFYVATTNALPLRATLVWTDPPGDPTAAIKLVNNLVLVVTNLSNPTNIFVYYGNDIPASSTFNSSHATNTNTPPVFDSINNVQNVNLPVNAGTNFSVTVMGYRVNVNAVTAQTNNVVQDYALVISCGNGQVTNVMTVSATPPVVVSNPTGDQQITYITGNDQVLVNQFVGANTPLLGTNTVPIGTNTVLDTNLVKTPISPGFASNAVVTVGMTNQWHFYVITNTFAATNSAFTNAAFVTFNPNSPDPDTLSLPREGVFAGSVGNASRDADIDLYVTTDSNLLTLSPQAISNCVHGTQIGVSSAGLTFKGASLGRGSTELVVDIGSQANEVYYIGVKSEDQMAAEYGFISIVSATPFSQMQNGAQQVKGVPLPVNIPDGSPTVPGRGFVFGLALYPIQVGGVTVSDSIVHEHYEDLIGTLTLNGGHADVLNNHDSFGNPPGPLLYDDSAGGGMIGSRPSDGPGSLNGYLGLSGGPGVWLLSEVDDSLTQTGSVQGYTVTIQPHQDLKQGITATVQPGSFLQVGSIDVPPGTTNLTVTATNFFPAINPPLELFVKLGSQPTTNSSDGMAPINNPGSAGLWGSVPLGPPLVSGRYFVGIFNPSLSTPVSGFVFATIGLPFVPAQTIYSSTDTPKPILDDAVTTDFITVPDNQTISSLEVALRVDHPRVSDLVFHLIGPDGTRDLLVENRGGTTTNGMGATIINTNNFVAQTFSGGAETSTNVINAGSAPGTLQISYNFYGIPDELAVFDTNNVEIFDSLMVSGSGIFSVPYTNSPLTIVMNPNPPGNNGGPGDAWTYTVTALQTNQYSYLVLTENTNFSTTPIKFAPPPFGTTNFTVKTNYYFGLTSNMNNADLFYLPEQSLDAYHGLNAQGLWTLEIQGDRVGATNPAPTLLNWQLRFLFTTTGTNSTAINPGTTVTNVIPAGSIAYYPVNVPTNADFATNILLFATGPLNVWFNQNGLPVGANPPDTLLLGGSTGGTSILTTNGAPPLLPGQTYYIGLQNNNAFPVTNGFAVNFHLILPIVLTNGVPVTNSVPTNSFFYFAVTVPTNADFATNILLFATAPVNVWFNQNGPPIGVNPPDYLLITNALNGTNVLSASTVPPLVPGATYFLGVQNTNGVPVNFGLEVDFHLVPAPPIITGPTITSTNIGGTNGFLLQWSGPTNYQYFIQWTTNLALPAAWNTVLNPVINVTFTPTNGHYSWFDNGSLTGGWPPAKFYRVLANLLSGPITNSAPVTNVIVAGSITPLTVTVPANAIAASNVLASATGPVNVYFNQTGPPTGTNAGDVLMLSAATSGTFVLTGSSVPPLVPGANYYLGLQNLGPSNVTFVFQVNFAFASSSTNPPSISSITLTNISGTNAVLLKWVAPTNYQFQIQWATNLAPAIAWHTIPNVVLTWSGILSPTNAAYGIFQFLDDGSLTGGFGPLKFYRLIEYPYSTPIPQTLTIINSGIIGGSVRFQWVAPTNYQYQILWTTNLGLPLASWSILANPALGLSNGVYTFTDTNQTGPPTSPKFFRLIEQ